LLDFEISENGSDPGSNPGGSMYHQIYIFEMLIFYMISLSFLRKEHEMVERELIELEENMCSEEINYSNIKHVFSRLINLWNFHEEKEEKIFKDIKDKNPNFNLDKMVFEHRELTGIKKAILETLNSGSDSEIKASLDTDVKMLIEKLRKHMKDEEVILNNLDVM